MLLPVESLVADDVCNGEFEEFLEIAFEKSEGRDVYVVAQTRGYTVGYACQSPIDLGFEVPATYVKVSSNQVVPKKAAKTIREIHRLLGDFEAIARRDYSAKKDPLWTLYIKTIENPD